MRLQRGMLGRLPYAATGPDGAAPVVALAGLSPTTGVDSDGLVRGTLAPLASLAGTRRLVAVNRRPDLPRGMTMSDLAGEHADALRELGAPVDVVGMSTGGSIAAQLAAEHPDVVSRLVLLSAACRLGPVGRDDQARVARRIRAGRCRRALAGGAASLVPPWRGRRPAALAGWLLAPVVVRRDRDWSDLATTIEAEDGFDLATCPPVRAATVIVAGRLDRFYGPALFEETARLVPDSRLHLLDGRGHVTVMRDPRAASAIRAFLRR